MTSWGPCSWWWIRWKLGLTKIRSNGVKAMFFNVNAADEQKRTEVLDEVAKQADSGIHCLVHSLAFGTLKPFTAKDAKGTKARAGRGRIAKRYLPWLSVPAASL